MRILDRYITHSILRIFLSAILIFSFLFILIDVTSHLDEYIDRKVPLSILLEYYLYFLPYILVQTASFSCLISVLLTYSSLSNNNEVIAMRASGLNFWKIARPALFFALIISGFVFFLSERFVPKATEMTQKIENENMILEADRYNNAYQKIENLTFYGLKNRLYYVESFEPQANELYGITIIENDENQEVKEKTVALNGVWTGIAWKFYKCQVTQYGPGGINNPTKVKVYEEKLMDIEETPRDFMKQRVNVDSMNILELKGYIDKFASSGATKAINNLRVDLHQKIAAPFANFVIVFAGLPFALILKSRKGMTFASLGIAVLVGFLFYVANSVAIAFGKGGALPPFLCAWTTPLLFIGTALLVIESKF